MPGAIPSAAHSVNRSFESLQRRQLGKTGHPRACDHMDEDWPVKYTVQESGWRLFVRHEAMAPFRSPGATRQTD